MCEMPWRYVSVMSVVMEKLCVTQLDFWLPYSFHSSVKKYKLVY